MTRPAARSLLSSSVHRPSPSRRHTWPVYCSRLAPAGATRWPPAARVASSPSATAVANGREPPGGKASPVASSQRVRHLTTHRPEPAAPVGRPPGDRLGLTGADVGVAAGDDARAGVGDACQLLAPGAAEGGGVELLPAGAVRRV